MSGRICSCGCNRAQSRTRFLYDSQWKLLHFFAGDRGWHHHGGKFCAPVSVLYQSLWKFSVSLYIGFVTLCLDYYLLHAIVHVLQLLVGTKQSATEFCAWCQMCSMWSTVIWVTVLVFQNSNPAISIAETVYKIHVSIFFICKCVQHSDYPTVLQHSPSC